MKFLKISRMTPVITLFIVAIAVTLSGQTFDDFIGQFPGEQQDRARTLWAELEAGIPAEIASPVYESPESISDDQLFGALTITTATASATRSMMSVKNWPKC